MKKTLVILAVAALAVVVAMRYWSTRRALISFAPPSSPPMDFAKMDHDLPLSIAELESLTPDRFDEFTQEQVDEIYGRLTAGPIPDGPYDGDLFFPRGSGGQTRLTEILGGHLGSRFGNMAVRATESLGRTLWKGKVFYRRERLLRNRIEDLAVVKLLAGDNTEGIEKISVRGRDAFLLFPAKLYCGQSLLDGRRESIIIDYAFTDELPGYREHPDALGGRNGFQIRDEIRMVRPGFYLGRAYLNRVFGVNFTLLSQDAASAGQTEFRAGRMPEDCWSGTQQVVRR